MPEIVGIGVDIEEISRFEKNLKNKKFLDKIFTKQELEYCFSKGRPAQHLAARFCAKEAVIKAIPRKINYKDVEIKNNGIVPEVKVKSNDKFKILVSLTHSNSSAMAFVLLQIRSR
ncbi:MAG: holo-ACP synthase [Candidatus Aenigmarchaeota archaeon]|nr:holo-ACP synthase [Candidatus Aenigmarchaeota archaeon]